MLVCTYSIFNVSALNQWTKPSIASSRNVPANRRGHTAVACDSVMYIFGGYVDMQGSTNELWILDLGMTHPLWFCFYKNDSYTYRYPYKTRFKSFQVKNLFVKECIPSYCMYSFEKLIFV